MSKIFKESDLDFILFNEFDIITTSVITDGNGKIDEITSEEDDTSADI